MSTEKLLPYQIWLLFYLLLTKFCGLASFQCGCPRKSFLYLTTSSCFWPQSLACVQQYTPVHQFSTDFDAAERHRDINNNTREEDNAFNCWLYPAKRGSSPAKANSSWCTSQPPGQLQLVPAVAPQGALKVAASATGWDSRVTLSSAILLRHCSHPLSGGVRGKGDPGKPLTGCCAAARQSSASTPSLPECARRLPPVDVSLQLADRTRGAPHEGAKVSQDGALWSPGHCMNNPFPHQRFRLSAFLFSIVSTPWLLPSSQDWDEAVCAGITSSSQW